MLKLSLLRFPHARKTARLASALSVAGVVAFGLATSARAQTNLLTNGGFENTGGTFANNGAGGQSLTAGSTVIPGWTTTNAELAWLVNGNNYSLASQSGSYFLDLTGYHDATPYGGVTQSIATTIGASYTLSFYVGANQSNAAYAGPMGVAASAGSTSQSFTFTPSVGSTGNVYGSFSLPFTATNTTTAITITGTGSSGGQYLGLDSASVVANAAAPEPGSVALLALGMTSALPAVGRIARRRGQKCLTGRKAA